MTPLPQPPIPAVILAGGQGRRMGGTAKGLLPLGRTRILDEIVRRLAPQASPLLINLAPGDERYRGFALEPVFDHASVAGQGPLAGLLAALDWGSRHGHDTVATVTIDTPFLPRDLLVRLAEALGEADVAYAVSGERRHPAVALWRTDAADRLSAAVAGGMRRMAAWLGDIHAVPVRFDTGAHDPFFNINTPEDLAEAERIVAGLTETRYLDCSTAADRV